MASDVELKKIKKKYGEKFMHMCRDLFPTILEQEGALFAILENTFADNSKTLYEDIHGNNLEVEFKDYIYEIFDNRTLEKQQTSKTPYELLGEAGYDLYECTSEEDIQRFKKYFKDREELCTFNGGRLNSCVVFFAVKKNVGEIKREDFPNPKREDEYGTSVMSIQFYKTGMCTVSIKNRYNHRVDNPDATYGNNLDEIIPGLAKSFENLLSQRGMKFNKENIERFSIPNYVVASDGKYYKYNLEIDGTYYCPRNTIISQGQAISVGSPETKILVENFAIDLVNKTITQYGIRHHAEGYDTGGGYKDSFLDDLEEIEQIEVVRDKETKNNERIIIIKKKDSEIPVEIRIDRDNQIIGYKNLRLKEAGRSFLRYNKKLRYLKLPNLEYLGRDALSSNCELRELILPNLCEVGSGFLYDNTVLSSVYLPQLKKVGDGFFRCNKGLDSLELPELCEAGNEFLDNNERIQRLYLPKLITVGYDFLFKNICLVDVCLTSLTSIESGGLTCNTGIVEITLPNVTSIGNNFMRTNTKLRKIDMPKLTTVGEYFLYNNLQLEELSLPELRKTGSCFLGQNTKIKFVYLPSLEKVNNYFLYMNRTLVSIELPKLEVVGDSFLRFNKGVTRVAMPLLEEVRDNFMASNLQLKELKLPSLIWVGSNFLGKNRWLRQIEMEKLISVCDGFLYENRGIKSLALPNLIDTGNDFMPNNNIERVELPNLNKYGRNFLGDKSRKLNSEHLARLDKSRCICTYDIGECKKIIIGFGARERM